jgi:hypothetical protein
VANKSSHCFVIKNTVKEESNLKNKKNLQRNNLNTGMEYAMVEMFSLEIDLI